jgi:succinate-semialdehyde dehydrogenase/glutarate-semialdehyde dehydrogenase
MLTQTRYANPYLLIDGARIDAADRATQPVVNPANGEAIGLLPHATTADLDRALAAAGREFPAWRDRTAFERATVLRAGAALIRERAEFIATQQTLEQGKLYRDSLMEVLGSADHIEWYAEEGRRAYGRVIPARTPGGRSYVIRQAIGPVAAFSPWNFPATIPARKMGAALAAGCTMIIKPAEETPTTTLLLAQALLDGGVPAGVLNVVFGVPSDISTYLIASPVIRKVSFTGSTAVGKQLGRLAADGMKRTTMELGGHAPAIVFADANLERAVAACAVSKMRNVGQVCISPTRFFAHESVYEAFVQKMGAAVAALTIGDGFDPRSQVGPLANPRRVDAMERLVADAVAKGARVIAGGKRIPGGGFFFEPTVLADVPATADIMNEEPFGPIAVIAPFSTFAEVIAEANRLPYGLAGYAFTESLATATAVSDALEVGMVGINGFGIAHPETPFGGVKESGHGSEGGSEGLSDYMIVKTIVQS